MHVPLIMRFPRAEEVNDASRTLPKALFWGVALNAVLGYLAIFTLCFTIDDPEADSLWCNGLSLYPAFL